MTQLEVISALRYTLFINGGYNEDSGERMPGRKGMPI